jgi:hypothetical protein
LQKDQKMYQNSTWSTKYYIRSKEKVWREVEQKIYTFAECRYMTLDKACSLTGAYAKHWTKHY